MSDRVTLTADEVIATLRNSALPTLVTEGANDYLVFRRLEEAFSDIGLSVFPAGNRDSVLKVFERRSELPSSMALAFFADKDVWIFSGVPEKYDSKLLIFTDGYSIENDIFRSANLQSLMTKSEKELFQKELKVVVEWYALMISRVLRGDDVEIKTHPNRILGDVKFFSEIMKLADGEMYPTGLFCEVYDNPYKYLRGKQLFALLLRQLSAPGRVAKHSSNSLLDYGAVLGGALLSDLHIRIENIFRGAEAIVK